MRYAQIPKKHVPNFKMRLPCRRERPFASLLDFCSRVILRRDRLENLILAGAFDRLHDSLRGLLLALDHTVALAQTYRRDRHRRRVPRHGLPAKSHAC